MCYTPIQGAAFGEPSLCAAKAMAFLSRESRNQKLLNEMA